jgi:protein-disulfide isomerase
MKWRRLLLGSLLVPIVLLVGMVVYGHYRIIKPELTFVHIDISAAPKKGSVTAPLSIVEFADYQCPFCIDQARNVLPKLEADYIATGKVQYVFMNFPLPIHEFAPKAAHAAACAEDQGKFWQMHDLLFTTGKIAPEQLYEQARKLDLRSDLFHSCIDSGKHNMNIADDHAQGLRAHVYGTPTLFIGRAEQQLVTATAKFAGEVSYRSLRRAIDDLLVDASAHNANKTTRAF